MKSLQPKPPYVFGHEHHSLLKMILLNYAALNTKSCILLSARNPGLLHSIIHPLDFEPMILH